MGQLFLSRDHSRQQYKTKVGINSRPACYCYRARLADVWSGYQSIRKGGGGGVSLSLAKLQVPAVVLARYPSFMPNVNPECKPLAAYVGRLYQATCVTPCILEVRVRMNSQYNQVSSSRCVLLRTILLFMQKCSYLFSTNQRGMRRVRQGVTIAMFPACPVDRVVHYTTVRYVRTCRILDPASAFLDTLMIPNLTIPIPNRTTSEIKESRFLDISRDITYPQR